MTPYFRISRPCVYYKRIGTVIAPFYRKKGITWESQVEVGRKWLPSTTLNMIFFKIRRGRK
jgi:hypothetical protein